ncbi:MAG: alpha/beta hydrolase [Synechococcales cyanobacterium C42_A2020_086]|jgi:pimeloyl-ACP methyl ester carboxylesterase|nr:alpha/beta hydrolase [Synechococcales cyanobacterium M58_A2018_015]MBF2074112.1 alpha/beta hydrolase [Synechococcales cyanobacterium C42_A2020_086]
MPFISIRGVDHYYEWITTSSDYSDTGVPRSEKPVLVFVHGWAGSTRYWQSTALALADQFECLLYDLRGFGRSRLPRPLPPSVAALGYELESYADDLALLLHALKLQSVYLNAHSTGASIAALFLNRYPDLVQRAILTCNGVFEYDERAFKAFHRFGGYVVAFRPNWLLRIPEVERMFMARFLRRPIPRAAKRAFLEDFLNADYEAALGTVYTAVSQKAALEMPKEFAQLKVPTLLVSGEYDQIIPVDLGRQAAALNPQIQHIIIPNTGHFPMLEDAPTYLAQVNQFLQS